MTVGIAVPTTVASIAAMNIARRSAATVHFRFVATGTAARGMAPPRAAGEGHPTDQAGPGRAPGRCRLRRVRALLAMLVVVFCARPALAQSGAADLASPRAPASTPPTTAPTIEWP